MKLKDAKGVFFYVILGYFCVLFLINRKQTKTINA